jgi:hypothetical protein
VNASTREICIAATSVGLIAVITVIFSLAGRKYGIEVIKRWADAEGLQLIRIRRRSLVPHWRWESSKGFQFFAVDVRERNGVERKVWMKLESDTNAPCIVEVKWEGEDR